MGTKMKTQQVEIHVPKGTARLKGSSIFLQYSKKEAITIFTEVTFSDSVQEFCIRNKATTSTYNVFLLFSHTHCRYSDFFPIQLYKFSKRQCSSSICIHSERVRN